MKTCAGCQSLLPDKRGRGGYPLKWCSGACRVRTFRGSRPLTRFCVHCEAPFESTTTDTRKRWCSVECRQKSLLRGPQFSFICAGCGLSGKAFQSKKRYCSESCFARARWQLRPRIAKQLRQRILRRDGWRCYLCERAIDTAIRWPHGLSGTVDHVVPVSAGGSDNPANLRAAHWECNVAKGSDLPEWWLTQRMEVA